MKKVIIFAVSVMEGLAAVCKICWFWPIVGLLVLARKIWCFSQWWNRLRRCGKFFGFSQWWNRLRCRGKFGVLANGGTACAGVENVGVWAT